jgi:hypothetical protein
MSIIIGYNILLFGRHFIPYLRITSADICCVVVVVVVAVVVVENCKIVKL